jgi:hypothetical protein
MLINAGILDKTDDVPECDQINMDKSLFFEKEVGPVVNKAF